MGSNVSHNTYDNQFKKTIGNLLEESKGTLEKVENAKYRKDSLK